jgi:hypothetical protein
LPGNSEAKWPSAPTPSSTTPNGRTWATPASARQPTFLLADAVEIQRREAGLGRLADQQVATDQAFVAAGDATAARSGRRSG